jgi:hypothetical protein
MKMDLPRGGRLRWALLGAVAAGLAVGGLAYGSIPDGTGVIHGCYKNTGGSLRVIDTGVGGACNASETALPWSQTGPRGTTGARGPTGSAGTNGSNGAKGATGPTGPSTASAGVNESSFSQQTMANNTFKSIQALSLPAGSYLINVTAAFVSPTGTTAGGFVRCQLFANGSHVGAIVSLVIPPATNPAGIVPYSGAVNLAAAATVSFDCAGDSTLVTQPSTMTAVRVGSLTLVN